MPSRSAWAAQRSARPSGRGIEYRASCPSRRGRSNSGKCPMNLLITPLRQRLAARFVQTLSCDYPLLHQVSDVCGRSLTRVDFRVYVFRSKTDSVKKGNKIVFLACANKKSAHNRWCVCANGFSHFFFFVFFNTFRFFCEGKFYT